MDPFPASGDALDAEFGASPLGKSAAAAAAPLRALQGRALQFYARPPASAAAQPQAMDTAPGQLDLYGDLYGDDGEGKALLQTQLAQLRDQTSSQQKLVEELQARVGSLTSERDQLQHDRDNLTRNISSLFNTAKMEIQRKDDEIKELRGKAAAAAKPAPPGQGGGGPSAGRQRRGESPEGSRWKRDSSERRRGREESGERDRSRSMRERGG